jgi:SAM-dependent methyltransferase
MEDKIQSELLPDAVMGSDFGMAEAMADIGCSICSSSDLQEVPWFRDLPRVTSDCRPFPAGGRLAVCMACGTIQKPADGTWLAEIDVIYRNFALYHQSGGVEQAVFDSAGRGQPRSQRLIDFFDAVFAADPPQTVLDFGCGNGATLRALSRKWPNAALYGVERSEANADALRKIAGFRRLYARGLAEIDQTFDMITLVHSLEHLVSPLETIEGLRRILAPGGKVIIQVPDAAKNPYDLLVADHHFHFTATTLQFATARGGIESGMVMTEAIPKELTYIGYAADSVSEPTGGSDPVDVLAKLNGDVRWLQGQLEAAWDLARSGRAMGVFGSSIAAVWLMNGLGDAVKFFVDEDPSRAGRTIFDRPVVALDCVPTGSVVFVPLVPSIAQSIGQRLRSHGISFLTA